MVLDHFTENFWPKGHLTVTPFDRTLFERMPFDRKFIRPNRRLTERRLTESSFYRKVMWPIFLLKMVIWPNLLSTKNVIWPKKIAHKVVWPKIHLTESSFDQKLFLKMIMTECFFLKNCRFRKIIIWPTVHIPLEKYMCPTSSSPPGTVFLYCHYYYSNRIENIIKVTDLMNLKI
jgi:hypothetical protein